MAGRARFFSRSTLWLPFACLIMLGLEACAGKGSGRGTESFETLQSIVRGDTAGTAD